jgi:hypothetical protein
MGESDAFNASENPSGNAETFLVNRADNASTGPQP